MKPCKDSVAIPGSLEDIVFEPQGLIDHSSTQVFCTLQVFTGYTVEYHPANCAGIPGSNYHK